MKKKITTLILSLAAVVAFGQQTKTKGLKFGVRAGVNFATAGLSGSQAVQSEAGYVTNFSFLGYLEIPLTSSFSIQPSFGVSGKGSTGNSIRTINVPLLGALTVNFNNVTNIMYLEAPLNAVYTYKNFYVGAGPYIAYAVAGNQDIEITEKTSKMPLPGTKNVDIDFGKNAGQIDPLDYGVNFLLGYKIKYGFNIGVNYGLGLGKTLVQNGYDVYAANRVASVLVGFSF